MNNTLFFETYYYNIINNIFDTIDDNNNILLIIKNDFNILDHFSHIIKKKNIKIDIIIENNLIYNNLVESIKDEECEENINIYLKFENINSKIYNIINIFHLDSNEYFENILNKINSLINDNTIIYLYCSLSNEKNTNIDYKNYFRKLINQYININVGCLLKLNDILNIIDNFQYNIMSIKIYKKNNYLLYGDNTVYQIIMNKKINSFEY
jgi:hypothetical protein